MTITIVCIQGNSLKDRGKMFEGSLTRVMIIMIITYCTIFGYLNFLGVSRPGKLFFIIFKAMIKDLIRLIHFSYHLELNAIVPTVGFNLSTWSLPYVKVIWLRIYDYLYPITDTHKTEKDDLVNLC